MIVYAFMPAKKTKEELIENMIFLMYFGDVQSYLKKFGIVKKGVSDPLF